MKKLVAALVGMLVVSPVWADNDLGALLNRVTLQLRAEKWVTTQTAQVTVGVNAGVSDAGIEKMQGEVLAKLQQFSAQSEWHIVSFSRQQDKSGLESIQIVAQARLPQAELAALRTKAKSLSKPGETYTIDDVQFTPSDAEITQANNLLRGTIYQQAKAEIDALNHTYPEQKYYLHNVDFIMSQPVMPMAATAMYRANKVEGAPVAQPLNVGNKLEMMATVTLASMPDVITAKKSPLINP